MPGRVRRGCTGLCPRSRPPSPSASLVRSTAPASTPSTERTTGPARRASPSSPARAGADSRRHRAASATGRARRSSPASCRPGMAARRRDRPVSDSPSAFERAAGDGGQGFAAPARQPEAVGVELAARHAAQGAGPVAEPVAVAVELGPGAGGHGPLARGQEPCRPRASAPGPCGPRRCPRPPPAARSRWPDRASSCPHSVGVMKDRLATSSATDRSPVWPMPVHTGTTEVAMARATRSWSNAARSALDPPPRTTTMRSRGSVLQPGDGRRRPWSGRPSPGRWWAPP